MYTICMYDASNQPLYTFILVESIMKKAILRIHYANKLLFKIF